MAQAQDASVAQLKQVFGGNLSDSELAFLRRIQQLFHNVVQERRGFNVVVELLAEDLRDIVRTRLELRDRMHIDGFDFHERIAQVDENAAPIDAKLSQVEEHFAQDVIGAIDFVVRNGVGFSLIANVLYHDVTEILAEGSLEIALNKGFLPKTSGWASYDETSIGDPEQQED